MVAEDRYDNTVEKVMAHVSKHVATDQRRLTTERVHTGRAEGDPPSVGRDPAPSEIPLDDHKETE